MKRSKLYLLVALFALGLIALAALPAAAQGLVIYIDPYLTCTEWGTDGLCLGDVAVVWPVLDGVVNKTGCEELVIDDDATLEVFCQYEDPTTYYLYTGWASITRNATSAEQAIGNIEPAVSVLEVNGVLNAGQADSLRVKLVNAGSLVAESRYLPGAELLAAFVYEGTSLVKGDNPPDWLPWDAALNLSESLEAVKGITPPDF